MTQAKLQIPNDFEAIREHIRQAQVGRAVVLSEILANSIVTILHGVKRFFASAASANNSGLPTPSR